MIVEQVYGDMKNIVNESRTSFRIGAPLSYYYVSCAMPDGQLKKEFVPEERNKDERVSSWTKK